MTRVSTLIALPGLLAMASCVNLSPAYVRSVAPVPEELPVSSEAAAQTETLRWNNIVTSDALRALITLALEENRDLRVTAANVRLAQARLMVSRAGLFPAVSASVRAQEGDTFDGGAATGTQSFSDSASADLGVTVWELDFFGRIASGNEAALQTYLSTVEGERATRLALVASVCDAWLQLAADQELLKLAEDTVNSQSKSLELTRALVDAGAANELDLRRASASVQSARAQAALFQTSVRQDLNLLRRLVGTDLPDDVSQQATLEPSPLVTQVPVGQSSDVLLARPDILAAERQLLAANANIGAARAAYFPSISLTGSVGNVSQDLSSLVGGDGLSGWAFGPSISLPIYDGGARRGNLEASKANADAAVASYEAAIQSAFRETADALAVSETIDTRLDALSQLTEDTGVTLYLSEERFRAGLDDYLTVLDAQREDYSGRQQLIAARLDRGRNTVSLFRALGSWVAE